MLLRLMRLWWIRLLLGAVLILGSQVAFATAPAPSGTIAIRADMVLPIATRPIRNGVVLVRNGKIVAIGTDLPLPPGTKVIRARVVMPGLIDAHTYLGCDYETDEPVDALTPDLCIRDTFDPASPWLRQALRAGVTTACIMPGNGNAIAGQGSVIRLGDTPHILVDYAAQKLSLSTDATNPQRNPTSRAGLLELVRGALEGARQGKAASSTSQTNLLEDFPTTLDERCRALQPVLQGRRPVCVHAPTADDVENALQLMETFHLRGCLLHANEASTLGDRLRARQIPVILGPLRFSDSDRILANAGKLAKAGVRIAFCTDAPQTDPASLRMSAHLAVQYGLSPEAALRALTLNAARILGVDGQVGSLEAGKEADLLLLSGDPLDLTSRVEAVMVQGNVVYEGNH